MRLVALTLTAVAGLWFYLGAPNGRPSSLIPATASTPAVKRSAPPARPFDTKDRVLLTVEQQREASSAGGFRLMPLSLLRVDRRMKYGDFLWAEEGVPRGPISIRVDLRTQVLSVFRGGHEIGTAVVLYGADSKETPLGSFPILWKGKNHRSSLYDAPMPFTLRLTGDGVAIHGSNVRWGAATHGCVGVPTEFASKLFQEAKVGDVVTIVRSESGTKTAIR